MSSEEWIDQNEIKTSEVGLAFFDGERGVIADADIPAEQALVSVPVQAVLSEYPLQPNPFPRFCPQFLWKESPWYFRLALQLLHEKGKGQQSAFHPYINELPQDFDMPLQWAEEDMAELHYPCLNVMVETQREVYEAVRSRSFGGPFPGTTAAERTRLALLIAAAAAGSYFFLHLPFEQVANGFMAALCFNLIYNLVLSQTVQWHTLVPVVDFMNHRTGVPSDVAYEYFEDRMVARCKIPYKKGEQVFISYGDEQTNDSLLQFYGFVEPDCPGDIYQEKPHSRVQQILAHVCQQETSSWPTSLEEDSKLLGTRDGSLGSRKLMALQFRIEKKKVLGECISALQRSIEPEADNSDQQQQSLSVSAK
ncbi:hypothetical protein WJX73_004109 [Symbiochloris irregularis]|uniref:SET domain-containing protein n=1 Tax=Symbiochloris irregularis TaxID=706552 RepID=A0AAW1P5V2_9CHLO